jgi:hypothetical protein
MHIRSARRLASLTLGALVALPLLSGLACGGEGTPDLGLAEAPREVHHVRISASDLAALPAGQTLTVDLGAALTAYHFVLEPALDFSRIMLVSAEGLARPMDEVLAGAAGSLDPSAASDKRLVLAGDPTSFEELSDSQVKELLAQGTLVTARSGSGTPGKTPQTEDPCDDLVAYRLVNARVGHSIFNLWSSQSIVQCGEACTPGETRACYTGLPGTEGVGTCHGGVQTCKASGNGWTACAGEQIPRFEDCSTPADESCDGTNACPASAATWVASLPNVTPQGVAIDAQGNTAITGFFESYGSIDGTTLSGVGTEGFVAKLAPDGTLLWLKQLGGFDAQYGRDVALDAAGNVFVGGEFRNTVDFGTGPIAASDTDAFVVKYAPDGTVSWVKTFTGPGWQTAEHVTVDGAGNIGVSGLSMGSLYADSGPLPESGAHYVLELDPTGSLLWGRNVNGYVEGLGFDAAGNLALGGAFNGTLDLGAGPMTSTGGSYDVYIAKLSPSGAALWSKRAGDDRHQVIFALAVDGAGDVVASGDFNGTLSFGTPVTSSGGDMDAFVVKLDGASGAEVWTRAFTAPWEQHAYAMDTDSAGNVAVGIDFFTPVDLGTGVLASAGLWDIAAVKLAPDGTTTWVERIGGPQVDGNFAVAMEGGRIALFGWAGSSLQIGASVVPGTGGFLAMLQP